MRLRIFMSHVWRKRAFDEFKRFGSIQANETPLGQWIRFPYCGCKDQTTDTSFVSIRLRSMNEFKWAAATWMNCIRHLRKQTNVFWRPSFRRPPFLSQLWISNFVSSLPEFCTTLTASVYNGKIYICRIADEQNTNNYTPCGRENKNEENVTSQTVSTQLISRARSLSLSVSPLTDLNHVACGFGSLCTSHFPAKFSTLELFMVRKIPPFTCFCASFERALSLHFSHWLSVPLCHSVGLSTCVRIACSFARWTICVVLSSTTPSCSR